MSTAIAISSADVRKGSLGGLGPGLALCTAITLAAYGLQTLEARWLGRAWLEAVVLSILIGAAVRAAWTPGAVWARGVAFSAKTLLEIAVVLLGLTIDARTILDVGAPLLLGIAVLVAVAIAAGYGLGRLVRLPRRMAILIACGNAICGNSAIAAVAPVIGADGEDVTAAIAFTAVMGIGVVLGLPVAAAVLGLSHRAFGVFAGLTVYAVPQVLAAAAPVSALSAQVGTVVKLVRVLMLGPVVMVLSLLTLDARDEADEAFPTITAGDRPGRGRPSLHQLAPWFIIGFLLMVAARTAGLAPEPLVAPAAAAAGLLTVMSMAALGLGVDLRALKEAGPRVSGVAIASLIVLAAIALLLLHILRMV
jgi:uncharacterized integral membrane protein (TIGR00698 family)